MKKLVTLSTAVVLSSGLVACSSQPNDNLEQARAQYTQLQGDPRSSQLAALETEDASKMLERAEKAYNDGSDKQKIDQLSYLTARRIELAQQTIALRAAEQEIENASAKRAKAQLESRDSLLQRQQEEIRQLQQDLQTKQTARGTLVTFGDVFFDLNKSELTPSGARDVQKLAGFLMQNTERMVVVEGYTDNTGSDSYNQRLSERRADAVFRELTRAGVDPKRIQTLGYGEEYPVADNASPSGRAMNRRVEVTISNDNQRVPPRSSIQ